MQESATDDTAALVERLTAEGRITVAQAVAEMGVCQVTVSRWIRFGWKGIRLEAYRQGKEWITSRQAIQRFQSACTALVRPAAAPRPPAEGEGLRVLDAALAQSRAGRRGQASA